MAFHCFFFSGYKFNFVLNKAFLTCFLLVHKKQRNKLPLVDRIKNITLYIILYGNTQFRNFTTLKLTIICNVCIDIIRSITQIYTGTLKIYN